MIKYGLENQIILEIMKNVAQVKCGLGRFLQYLTQAAFYSGPHFLQTLFHYPSTVSRLNTKVLLHFLKTMLFPRKNWMMLQFEKAFFENLPWILSILSDSQVSNNFAPTQVVKRERLMFLEIRPQCGVRIVLQHLGYYTVPLN